jgi:hypothetical protein
MVNSSFFLLAKRSAARLRAVIAFSLSEKNMFSQTFSYREEMLNKPSAALSSACSASSAFCASASAVETQSTEALER